MFQVNWPIWDDLEEQPMKQAEVVHTDCSIVMDEKFLIYSTLLLPIAVEVLFVLQRPAEEAISTRTWSSVPYNHQSTLYLQKITLLYYKQN